MKTKNNNKIKQKIIIPIIILLLFNFIMPNYSQASLGGVLMSPICGLIAVLGDAGNRLVYMTLGKKYEGGAVSDALDTAQAFLGLGEDEVYVTEAWGTNDRQAFIDNNENLKYDATLSTQVTLNKDGEIQGDYGVPNIRITPAEIFSNRVSMLNANYFSSDTDIENSIGGPDRSVVNKLKETISGWYNTLRLISVVGLMSVLVYIGIRIILSSTAGDKAKYKERLKDWFIAMCLVFFLHYIMVFIMTAVDSITRIIGEDSGSSYTIGVTVKDGNNIDLQFNTNLVGYMRLLVEAEEPIPKLSAAIMYLALTFYTVYFTFIYLKRLLTLTFLTLIAPLVALTYPLDKLKDGKAQAFNYWLREYAINALLPVIHIILYTIFVTSAENLAVVAPLYAICALAFIIPAEKLVKSMFGFKSETAPGGSFAGGVMASQALQAIGKRGQSSGKSGNSSSGSEGKSKIKTYGDKGQINSSYSDLGLGTGENSNSTGNTGANNTGPRNSSSSAPSNNAQALDSAMANTMLGDWDDEPSTPGTGTNDSQNSNLSAGDPRLLDNAMANTMLGDWDDDEQGAQYQLSGVNANQPETTTSASTSTSTSTSAQTHTPTPTVTPASTSQTSSNRQIKNSVGNNIGNMMKRRYKAKTLPGAIAKAGLAGAKKATRFVAPVVGAGVGLAGGIVGGNMNDMFKGITLGATGGKLIGNNVGNRIENLGNVGENVRGRVNSIRNMRTEILHGEDAAAKAAREQEFSNNYDYIKYMKDNHKIGSEGYENLTRKEYNKKIKEDLKAMSAYSDVTDGDIKKMDKLYSIENKVIREEGVSKETAQKYTEQIGKISKNYDASYFNDKEKYNKAVSANKDKLIKSGLNEEQAQARAEKIMQQIQTYNKY